MTLSTTSPGDERELSEEQWYDLAEKYASKDWNGDQYFALIQAVGKDAIALASFGTRPAAEPYQQALDIRIAQGWQLGGNACPVLYTDTINGEQVCRDDLWLATTAGLKGAAEPIQSGSVGEAADWVNEWSDKHEVPLDNRARSELIAALSRQAPAAPAEAVWANFPSYLIDHCEGATITEEGLQRWLAAMLKDQKYAAPTPTAPWTLQGYQLATSGKAAWASRAFDPDATEGGSWSEWRLTSYEPPRQPDRWFEVVALPATPPAEKQAAPSGETAAVRDVLAERKRQDAQWGGPAHDDEHDAQDWASYIRRQLKRLVEVNYAESFARERFVKIAALAVAAVETIDRKQAAPSGEDNHG